MDYMFDVTVIGGGPGGYVAAIRAAQLGLKAAVIEERQMGGTCLNRGCIPTKSLLHSAEVFRTARHSKEYGITLENVELDYSGIVNRKDKVVRLLRSGVESLVKGNGITVISGRALLKDKNTIEVTGQNLQTITSKNIIIATGSRPYKPPIPGIEGDKVLDSDGALSMTACPEKVVIVGGGVIGVEFATFFNAIEKEVTIIEMMDTILPGVDIEISSALLKSLTRKGVKIFTGSRVTSIKSDSRAVCTFESNGTEMTAEGDVIIVAIGRKPNTEGLGLESVGIDTERGFIKVNEKMETSVKGIYAIGDVTGKIQLAHVASAQGLVAASNAAGFIRTMDYAVVPGCIYTSPEIATVGLTEAEAARRGHKVKVGKFPVGANGKSMIEGEREGIIKIITDSETGKILGAHIMAPRATDMISEICVAMKLEAPVKEIADTIHPHPTVSEIIMEAAFDVEGLCIHKK
jgi:dihydrolipoamide dehydrogenase